jgi:hypothetical protein
VWRSRRRRLGAGSAVRHLCEIAIRFEILSARFDSPRGGLGDPSYVAIFRDAWTPSMPGCSGYEVIQAVANPREEPLRQLVASRLVARLWKRRGTHRGVLQRAGQQTDESSDFFHADWCRRHADVVAPVANDQLASLGMPRDSESPVIVTRIGDLNNRARRSHS